MINQVKSGDIVVSLKGRDQARTFIVLKATEQEVLLADGSLRRVEKPKTKKTKHVRWLSRLDCNLTDKILSGEKVTNKEVRRTIVEFTES